MKRLLIFTDYYLPGFKGGGPVKSISLLVNNLKKEFDIYVYTRDKDLGSSDSYEGVNPGEWNHHEQYKVFYDNTNFSVLSIKNIIAEINPDLIYLNSFFSMLTIKVQIINTFYNKKILLAPRGELSEGALSLKSSKKKSYINVYRKIFLNNKVVFHTTSTEEAKEIKELFPDNKIATLSNLSATTFFNNSVTKERGTLKLYFVSRISRKKNLHYVLNILKDVSISGSISFKIIGPEEDREYYLYCKELSKHLPNNVKVEFLGPIHNEDIMNYISNEQFFILPTLGENYGHVIAESLLNSKPVILSNTTPWNKDVSSYKMGYTLSLNDKEKWIGLISKLIDMDDKEYQELVKNTHNYQTNIMKKNMDLSEKYKKMFEGI